MGNTKQILEYGVFFLVGLAPILVGSVHSSAVFLFIILLLPMLFLQFQKQHLRPSNLALLSGFMALISAVQLIPLPTFLPFHNMEVLSQSAILTQQTITWHPISLEPFLTADRGLRFLAIALFALLVASLTSRRFYRRAIFWFLVSGWVVLAFGLFLWLSKTTTFFGYTQSVRFRAPSPFINTNHGATYFTILSFASIAHFKIGESKPFAIVSMLSFFGVSVLHGSVGVLVLVAIAGLFLMLIKLGGLKKLFPHIGVGFLIITTFSLLLWWLELLPLNDYIQSLLVESTNRWELTKSGAQLALDWPLVGSGFGSIDTAILPLVDWNIVTLASIPTLENEILEYFGTGGIVVGIVFLCGHIWWTFQAIKEGFTTKDRRKHRWHAVFWILFFGIACLHFPWFTLGLSFPFVLLIQGTKRSETKLQHRKKLAGVGVAVLSILFGSFFYWHKREDIVARPLSANAWIRLATIQLKKGDTQNALVFAKQAVKIDPRPRRLHYLARVMAKSKSDPQEVVKLYKKAFRIGKANPRLILDMLSDLPKAKDRNAVLSGETKQVWIKSAELTRSHFDVNQAISLAFDAIEHPKHSKTAQQFAAQLFIDMKNPELAKMWSETHLVDDTFRNAIYLQQKDYEAFFAHIKLKPDSLPHDFVLGHYTQIVKDTGPKGKELVHRVHDSYCKSPIKRSRQTICWKVEAQFKIEKENWADAEIIYRRILNRSGDAIPLARFYDQQKQCLRIEKLIEEVVNKGMKKSLSRFAQKCAQH